MIRRRDFLSAVGGAVAWPLRARAQASTKIWRLGMLETTDRTMNVENFGALQKALREFGYIEGQNLKIEYRTADGRPERFPELTAELLRLQVDLILTRGTPATLAARNASGAIPIVMLSSADPFAIVASIARPGGNVTGLSSLLGELASKRLGLLKEIVPNLTRIGSLTDPDNPTFVRTRKTIEAAARSMGVQFLLLGVRTPEDIRPAFTAAKEQRIDAIGVGLETVTQANRTLIVELAAEHRLPAIYGSREFIDVGGLIAYGVNYPDLYRRAASYVDKILRGAKPADLPIEQPIKFNTIVNLKAAKAIGLTMPLQLLATADEVIE